MKFKFVSLIVIASTIICGCTKLSTVEANFRVIPLPEQIDIAESGNGFTLNQSTIVSYPVDNDTLKRDAELFAGYIEQLVGYTLKVEPGKTGKGIIALSDTLSADNFEAYEINIKDGSINVVGASPQGAFYGLQTLRKAISAPAAVGEKIAVRYPEGRVFDQPRFHYRGAHLDVSRHFMEPDSVKAFIDMVALHNVNNFHWHLTDDQGWRIESIKYPKLAEIASKRAGTMIGKEWGTSDSIPHGGYYTQDEIRDIVAYAAERHINVVPEVDLPGHMVAVLAAYPEFGCTGGPYEVWQEWGVSEDLLCAGNDSVYQFLSDILTEITDLFPSTYIHVGGDECPKVRWENCPKCQAKIKELNLKSDKNSTAEEKLQRHVMEFAYNCLNEKGRRMIGWDEILEGGIPGNPIIMSWRGTKGAIAAAKAGHNAIMTPTSHCYFDYVQWHDKDAEPLGPGYLPVERVYAFNPIPDELTEEEGKLILGTQCNLWREFIPTLSHSQYMELPRLAALCEVQWCDPSRKDYNDFRARFPQLANHYDALNYNYCRRIYEPQHEPQDRDK